jgi:hypothetical protein
MKPSKPMYTLEYSNVPLSKPKSKRRELLATLFLAELIKKSPFDIKPNGGRHASLAKGAVKYADELLKALK